MSAKTEVDKLEQLAQVLQSQRGRKLLLNQSEEFEDDAGKPQRAMATISTVHQRARSRSILLPPERTRFPWETASRS